MKTSRNVKRRRLGERGRSAGVAHAGGDAVDGDHERVAEAAVVGIEAEAAKDLHLQDVDGVDEGVAHLDKAAQFGVVLAQAVVARHLQHGVHCGLEPPPQVLPQVLVLVALHQHLVVDLSDAHVRLGEDHFDEVHRGLEEGPLHVHLLQRLAVAVADGPLEGLADAQPCGENHSGLRPGEDPWDGAQSLHAAALLTARGAAADVEVAQLLLRRRVAEILYEVWVLEHNRAVRIAADLRQLADELHPLLRARGCRRVKSGIEHRIRVVLQLICRHTDQPKLGLDHFSLLCHSKGALHRSGRLALHGQVQRAATTAHRAATSVEQGSSHGMLVAHRHHLLLALIERPICCQPTSVLPRIRVPKHNLLMVVVHQLQVFPVDGHVQQAVHHLPCPVQIVERLKQWSHAQALHVIRLNAQLPRYHEARLALQELHHQNVAGNLCHADHVGPEGAAAESGGHPKRVQYLSHILAHLHGGRNQRPLASQLLLQECDLLLLIPLVVGAHAEVLGDSVHCIGMAGGLLPDVHLHEAHAKAVDPTQQVLKPPLRNDPTAALPQRPVASKQGLREVIGVFEPLAVVVGFVAGNDFLHPLARVNQLFPNVAQHDAVRGVAVRVQHRVHARHFSLLGGRRVHQLVFELVRRLTRGRVLLAGGRGWGQHRAGYPSRRCGHWPGL
mmetsp:Transcript_11459/g.20727  ORF Transcript_11459/g.20727 Transcript_11459/m.20727 type:complete len:670 (+) Transcript_11459:134-2143(+)